MSPVGTVVREVLDRGESALNAVGRYLVGLTKLISEEQLNRAVEVCREVADRYLVDYNSNTTRRGWAIGILKDEFGLSDHLAGLLVEMAVAKIKHAEDFAVEAIEGALDQGAESVVEPVPPVPPGDPAERPGPVVEPPVDPTPVVDPVPPVEDDPAPTNPPPAA